MRFEGRGQLTVVQRDRNSPLANTVIGEPIPTVRAGDVVFLGQSVVRYVRGASTSLIVRDAIGRELRVGRQFKIKRNGGIEFTNLRGMKQPLFASYNFYRD